MTRVVVVVGPTASGKSALAVALARRCRGEVVSADAMAVYRGMDIGTAKPTTAERDGIPHHLVDWLEPEASCNAAQWAAAADLAIADITARGRLPIVAGGTPLYAKLLLEGVSAGAPRDATVRSALHDRYQREGPATLFSELERVDPTYAAGRHPNDERRIVRALEVWTLTGRPYSSFHVTDGIRRPDLDAQVVGLHWPRETLYQRIDQRTRLMFARGLVAEVASLRHRLSPEARQAVGYKEVIDHLDGRHDLATAMELVARHSRHLAKHQGTWYRSWTGITWLPGDAPDLIEQAMTVIGASIRP